MKTLHTLGLTIVAFFAMFTTPDIDEEYPGAPPIDNEAAAIHCAPPPPPPGSHYEYRATCTLNDQRNHKALWIVSQNAYKDAAAVFAAELAKANETLATYLAIDPMSLPPDEREKLRTLTTNARGVVVGLEKAIEALDKGWRNTKLRLEEEFYINIADCCHIVEDDDSDK